VDTGTGTALLTVELSPSSPYVFSPQQVAWPLLIEQE
jgi:hypothetical protein